MLGATIKQAMEKRGLSPSDIGRHFDVHPSTVSRWLSGEIALTVHQVVEIEQFLNLKRGELFIGAGLVTLPQTTEEVIRADPALAIGWADMLVASYEMAVVHSAGSRSPSAHTAPTKSKSRRT